MRNVLWALSAVLVAGAPARAEVVASSDVGFVSRNAVEVAVPPQDAWKALVAPAGWWNGEHTYSGDPGNLWLDAQATGCFCEKLPLGKDAPEGQRPGSIEHMRIVYAQTGRVLRMVGGLGPLQSEAATGTLTVTLRPVAGGTRILWEYVVGGYMRYKTEQIGPMVDGVMASQLARLGARLGLLGAAVAPINRGPAAAVPVRPAPVGPVPVRPAPVRPAPVMTPATNPPADEAVADEFDKVLSPAKAIARP